MSGVNLQIEPDVLEPLVRRIVEETVAKLEQIRATLPDRLAFAEAEAARLLGLEQHVLRDERRRGRIQASAGPGGRILYSRENLVNYLAGRPWAEHQRRRTG